MVLEWAPPGRKIVSKGEGTSDQREASKGWHWTREGGTFSKTPCPRLRGTVEQPDPSFIHFSFGQHIW